MQIKTHFLGKNARALAYMKKLLYLCSRFGAKRLEMANKLNRRSIVNRK